MILPSCIWKEIWSVAQKQFFFPYIALLKKDSSSHCMSADNWWHSPKWLPCSSPETPFVLHTCRFHTWGVEDHYSIPSSKTSNHREEVPWKQCISASIKESAHPMQINSCGFVSPFRKSGFPRKHHESHNSETWCSMRFAGRAFSFSSDLGFVFCHLIRDEPNPLSWTSLSLCSVWALST